MCKCEKCGISYRNFGLVTLSDRDKQHPETICVDCYNKKRAKSLGVKVLKKFEPNIIQKDCEGVEHRFVIRKMMDDLGIFWEAAELSDDTNVGYTFEVYQKFEDTAEEAVKNLYEKIKGGLEKKLIKKDIFIS